jgi:hypothetical protein
VVTAIAILAALLAITSPGAEAPEARALRLARAAVAIEQVSASQPWLAPALVATVRAESHGDVDVHSGRRVSSAGAVCLTQIHRGNRLRAWELDQLVGTDYAATLRCMHVAAVTLVVSRAHCRKQRYLQHWAPAMFSVYVTGGECWKAKDRFARAATMYRVAGTAWAETDEMRAAIAVVRVEAALTEANAPEGFGPSAGAETSAKENDDDSNAQQESKEEAAEGEPRAADPRGRAVAGAKTEALGVDSEGDGPPGREARVSRGDSVRRAWEQSSRGGSAADTHSTRDLTEIHERETTTPAPVEGAEARANSDAEGGVAVQERHEMCSRVHRAHARHRRSARSLRSSGWVPATERTVAMARWARSLLELPDGEIRIREFGSRELLARREPHCDAARGWHDGVTLYERGGR